MFIITSIRKYFPLKNKFLCLWIQFKYVPCFFRTSFEESFGSIVKAFKFSQFGSFILTLFRLWCLLNILIFVVLVGATTGGKVPESASLRLVFFETIFWLRFGEWWLFFSSSTCRTSWTKSSNTWFKMKHKNDHENWRQCEK